MNKHVPYNKILTPAIIFLSLTVFAVLAYNTYYINYWPTDSGHAYIPSARTLFQNQYLSQMHQATHFSILPGKESLILGIAIMQRLLGDYASLYPNILLLIIAGLISTNLIYFIFKKWFNTEIGFLAAFLFLTTFWPYQYILLGAHQPLVFMFFLLAVFAITLSQKKIAYLCSGISIGFMLFASPTSPLYALYFISFYLYKEFFPWKEQKNFKKIMWHIGLMSVGFLAVYLLLTMPDPLAYIKRYHTYVQANRFENHFHLIQQLNKDNVSLPESFRGAGLGWVFKYFFLILPVMFTGYLVCLVYLAKQSIKKPALALIILLSLSTPLSVEIIKTAQIGRSYFSWLIGMLLLISFAVYQFFYQDGPVKESLKRKIGLGCLLTFVVAHLISNASIFFGDVYPSRMANTAVYHWLADRPFKRVFSYKQHPYKHNVMDELNNPKLKQKIFYYGIDSIKQVPTGYILIPPITGKSIWENCALDDFKGDPHLTQLIQSGQFAKYVVASFPTVSSSKIWLHEEEYCSYLDINLKKVSDKDRTKGFAWILDADKLQREWFSSQEKLR